MSIELVTAANTEEHAILQQASALMTAQRAIWGRLELPERARRVFDSRAVRETTALTAVKAKFDVLVLSGGPGCGKTVGACSWLRLALLDHKLWDTSFMAPAFRTSCRFVTAARLSRWSRYDNSAMAELLRAGRLVIDDLGSEFMDASGSYLTTLTEVITDRYDNLRPTLLTTNLDGPAFRARYGDRIADRVSEGQSFVTLVDPSLRSPS